MENLIATAAVIRQNGRILVTQRKADDTSPLKWEFPGGKMENGESPEECLKREIKEELGMDISVNEPVTFTSFPVQAGRIFLLFFECSIISGTPQLIECSDLGWFSNDEIEQLDLLPADRGVLSHILR